MLSFMSQNKGWQLLVVLCALAGLYNAANVQTKRNPVAANSLKITLDYPLAIAWPVIAKGDDIGKPDKKAQAKRMFMFSSHITFPGPVSVISDAQLWQIALDAHAEIAADMVINFTHILILFHELT
jgi:hypothetical protein